MPPLATAARLAAVAFVLGSAAGLAAAGDIGASKRAGRIGSAFSLPLPVPAEAEEIVEPGDPALAHAHGFALAAQRGFRRPEQCRSVTAEFRSGCLDYLERGANRRHPALDLL